MLLCGQRPAAWDTRQSGMWCLVVSEPYVVGWGHTTVPPASQPHVWNKMRLKCPHASISTSQAPQHHWSQRIPTVKRCPLKEARSEFIPLIYLQGFRHPRSLFGISSINSIPLIFPFRLPLDTHMLVSGKVCTTFFPPFSKISRVKTRMFWRHHNCGTKVDGKLKIVHRFFSKISTKNHGISSRWWFGDPTKNMQKTKPTPSIIRRVLHDS